MIPTKEALGNVISQIESVCFTFAEEGEHEFEKQFPCTGRRLEVVVTPRDRISGVDLSFCCGKEVWIDATPIDFRRARYLWKELLRPEHWPAAIFADTEKGLTVFKPHENKKLFFGKEGTNDNH